MKTMDDLDFNHLKAMTTIRDANLDNDPAMFYYYQGRIDEYCAQNAIEQEDVPRLDLRLPSEP